ncbi:MAG: hypothetical protein WC651_03490 [Candidatus Gracilibacteria bacterium]|jgi:hypothetical protein
MSEKEPKIAAPKEKTTPKIPPMNSVEGLYDKKGDLVEKRLNFTDGIAVTLKRKPKPNEAPEILTYNSADLRPIKKTHAEAPEILTYNSADLRPGEKTPTVKKLVQDTYPSAEEITTDGISKWAGTEIVVPEAGTLIEDQRTLADGTIEEGKFDSKTGKLREGRRDLTDGTKEGGHFDKFGELEQGLRIYADGTKEKGIFYFNGKLMRGTRTLTDGTIEKGQFDKETGKLTK